MGPKINLAAIAPLLAAVFMGSLVVVSLASGRKERVWKAFAVFCFLDCCAATAAFLGFLQSSPAEALVYLRFIPAFVVLSFTAALFYIALLTERTYNYRFFGRRFSFRITERSVELVLGGRKISPALYFAVVGTVWTLIFCVVGMTDLVVRSIGENGAIEFGPLVHPLAVLVLIGSGKVGFFLFRARSEADDPALKAFLTLNMVAFGVVLVPSMLVHIVLPAVGYEVRPLGFLGFVVAGVTFYLGTVRYQQETIRGLNRNLEAKVEARTRALKEAQVQLAQSQKMASLGELVAGVAHEVNNPLGSVRSMHHTLQRAVEKLKEEISTQDSAKTRKLLGIIDEANGVIDQGTERVEHIVARLRAFARLDEAELQSADINQGLQDTLSLLDVPKNVSMEAKLGALPQIRCYPKLLNQVWMNLLSNAKLAVAKGKGGAIEVSSEPQNGCVCVQISDTGVGIEESDLGRIFDPGFTKWDVGVGVGLGLATCYRIVQDHGGAIDVRSKVGEGTTVSVRIPGVG